MVSGLCLLKETRTAIDSGAALVSSAIGRAWHVQFHLWIGVCLPLPKGLFVWPGMAAMFLSSCSLCGYGCSTTSLRTHWWCQGLPHENKGISGRNLCLIIWLSLQKSVVFPPMPSLSLKSWITLCISTLYCSCPVLVSITMYTRISCYCLCCSTWIVVLNFTV